MTEAIPTKRVAVSTAVLSLILGATAFSYAQQDKQNEKQGKPQQQQQSQNNQRAQQQHNQNNQQEQQHAAQQQQNQNNQQQQRAQLQLTSQQRQAHSFASESRNWQQRGGYNGYRISDAYFGNYYGPNHAFRVYGLPFMVVRGFPRFQYAGYWFSLVDPYPEYWGADWYQTDDVYVNYTDDGYYLYDRDYPGRPGVAISISF